MKSLGLALPILFSVFFSCSTDPSPNLVLMDQDFESGSISPWEGQYSTAGYSLKLVSDIARSGSRSCKFTIGANDVWTSPNTESKSARSEIQIFDVAPPRRAFYYGWSVLIPSDYVESADWQVIGQFHDQPDTGIGQTWASYPPHSPPLAINYKNGMLQLAMSAPDNIVRVISERAIAKGQWHDVILHVYWSTKKDGFVEAWIDGIPLAAPDGMVTRHYGENLYNNAGNYLKIGLYRSMDIQTENSVFFDEIRSGLSFESVQIN
jgi:hypothetical protein